MGAFVAACGSSGTSTTDGGTDAGADGGTMAAVSGVVTTEPEETDGGAPDGGMAESVPVAGATVQVHGTSMSTTTNANGEFAFDVPIGDVFLEVTPDTDYWGIIELHTVTGAGLADVGLEVVPAAQIAGLAELLEVTVDDAEGVLAVFFDLGEDLVGPRLPAGDETATLSETSEFSFSFDSDEMPMMSTTLIEDGGFDLIFVGIAPTETATVTPVGGAESTCEPASPGTMYPVAAKTITDVDVVCTEIAPL